jgi:hypothetical protein
MHSLGRREVVGLVVLAVALAIGFLFLNPAASESTNGEKGAVHLGETVTPTPVTTPTATATPPPAALPAPAAGWLVEFFEVSPTGGSLQNGQGVAQSVDMTFAGAPFPDFKDDKWFVRATNAFTLEGGTYKLTITHDCDLHVSVDGTEIANDPDGAEAKTADIVFQHAKGRAEIVVECRDVGGPFRLLLQQ